ncbi:MAG TPA: type II secretion system protein GspK [Methylococcaceae bacterium]|nr:type II secretion system protein GspK [Methylococcaceae bacterium]
MGWGQRGVALILVLWLVTLLSVVASAFALSVRRESVLLRTARDRSEAQALVDGALQYAWLRLRASESVGRWLSNAAVYEVVYGAGRVRLELRDEAGKVNLNLVKEPMLNAFFTAAGLSSSEAAKLTDAVADWRDSDELRRLNGAEAEDYRLAGREFGPRNRPFEAVEELRAVLGMSPELYQRVAPWLTVYSGQAGIDPRSAPPELLLALPGVDAGMLDALAEGKQDAGGLLANASGITFAKGNNAAVAMRAEARLENGSATAVQAVLGRAGVGRPAYLFWREKMSSTEHETSLFERQALETVRLDGAPL